MFIINRYKKTGLCPAQNYFSAIYEVIKAKIAKTIEK